MVRALMIGTEEQARINAAVAEARAHPYSIEHIKAAAIATGKPNVAFADRPPDARPLSVTFRLPVGFTVSISFEYQPDGLCRHLSVSVDQPGALPNEFAVGMIATACGFREPLGDGGWLEEFAPGHQAVNIVELVERTPEGHA